MSHGRPSWDEYFFQITALVASRSTCLRRQVGAVLVREKRILSTGYNGAPQNLPHCLDIGCLRAELQVPSGERHELCRAIHAEQNAIIQAARHGVSIVGSTLYCTTGPCAICAKMLINSGVVAIHFQERYADTMAEQMLAQANVTLIEVPK